MLTLPFPPYWAVWDARTTCICRCSSSPAVSLWEGTCRRSLPPSTLLIMIKTKSTNSKQIWIKHQNQGEDTSSETSNNNNLLGHSPQIDWHWDAPASLGTKYHRNPNAIDSFKTQRKNESWSCSSAHPDAQIVNQRDQSNDNDDKDHGDWSWQQHQQWRRRW